MTLTGSDPIRILIADDHPIFRGGLRRLLQSEPGLSVVGEAADAHETLRQVDALRPDVLLLDLNMPGGGLLALKELHARRADVRVVVLTASIDRAETIEALRWGVRGVFLKASATNLLFRCIRAVTGGEFWMAGDGVPDVVTPPQPTTRPADRRSADRTDATPAELLTRRELEIIAAVVDGGTNRDVSQRFGVSEQTVKNHLSHIFDKVGVSSRLELALYAVHRGLVDRVPANGRAES
ncbi:MAG TPA: response regulator transcription factor [Vicinamibacterales bacterium]|jgi:DNA-binding NarL/FixJ family response regulator